MKHIKRFVFGVASSVLFALGLVRAADRFDPLSQGPIIADLQAEVSTAPYCANECEFES